MTVKFRTSNSLRAVVPVALSFLLSAASYAGVNYYYLDLTGATSGYNEPRLDAFRRRDHGSGAPYFHLGPYLYQCIWLGL